jgi:hypothetical protein
MMRAMDKIHVGRAGSKLGEFSLEDIRAGLVTGQFLGTDLGWRPGMADWQPLASFPEIAGGLSTAPLSPTTVEETPVVAETEPAWERLSEVGFGKAMIDTIKNVLFQPKRTFAQLKTTGGFLHPLAYYLITGILGGIGGIVYSHFFPGIETMMGVPKQPAPFGLMASFLMLPFVYLILIFLWAGLIHLCLMMVDGAKRGFETTFRVACYASGTSGLLGLLPIWVCGGFIGSIWGVVITIIGISQAHRISGGKATLGVLLPMIICCGGGLLLGLGAGVLAGMAGRG